MKKLDPSHPWEGRSLKDTQVFFQPDHYGVVELLGWSLAYNEHGQLCVLHRTPPSEAMGLGALVRVTDDRLRFFIRETAPRPAWGSERRSARRQFLLFPEVD